MFIPGNRNIYDAKQVQLNRIGDVGNSAQGMVKQRPALTTYPTKIASEKFFIYCSNIIT